MICLKDKVTYSNNDSSVKEKAMVTYKFLRLEDIGKEITKLLWSVNEHFFAIDYDICLFRGIVNNSFLRNCRKMLSDVCQEFFHLFI